MPWNLNDLPPQDGRTVVITGGNSGIGLEAARPLATRGARVVIACRSLERAQTAIEDIQASAPSAQVEAVELDLASQVSIARCAEALGKRLERVDVLINNAGVMGIPRAVTEDGFETQFGTNHLGHFALTGRLFDLLKAAPGARVVNVASLAHHFGFINFFNLHGQLFYDPWFAYAQSKLANLLFTMELERRVEKAGLDLKSVAAHPGISATNLGYSPSRILGTELGDMLLRVVNEVVAQSAAEGALPTLYAGFDASVNGGDYIGPDGPGEMRGAPRKVPTSLLARSRLAAERLWQVSEEATGVVFSD
jgi:NAD(P)-dependent dehydrogenase (short-subunit alcohol dehydrogenase family)